MLKAYNKNHKLLMISLTNFGLQDIFFFTKTCLTVDFEELKTAGKRSGKKGS